VADAETLKKARKLHQEPVLQPAPEDEDGLVAATRSRLAGWQSELKGFAPLAASKHHPGLAVIDGATTLIGKQLAIADSFEFVEALVKGRDAGWTSPTTPTTSPASTKPSAPPGSVCSMRSNATPTTATPWRKTSRPPSPSARWKASATTPRPGAW
jgi:hypothetical protein